MIYPGHSVSRLISGPPVLFEPIADRQASGDAQIDIAWTGDYAAVFIDIFNARPATDLQEFRCRTSSDGGTTFDAGASDYDFRLMGWFASQTNSAGPAAFARISPDVGNAADEACHFSMILPHPFDTTEQTQFIGFGGMVNNAGAPATLQLYGRRAAAGRVDAVRFFFAVGNIAEGRFTATGLRRG